MQPTLSLLIVSRILLALLSGGEYRQEPDAWAVRITFGTEDKVPTDWSGKLVGAADVINRVDLEAWQFAPGQGDALQPRQKGWKVQTRLGIAPLERQPVQGANTPAGAQVPWPVGVTIIGHGPEPDRFEVETAQGNFTVQPRELRWGISRKPLASVRVERTVAPIPATQRSTESVIHDDTPALVTTKSGEQWLAWLAFEGEGDQLLVAHWEKGSWSNPQTVSPTGDHAGIGLAEVGAGHLWAVWSQQVEGDWNVYGKYFNGRNWSGRVTIAGEKGPDINPVISSLRDDTAIVAWQGFHELGQSDIYSRVLPDGSNIANGNSAARQICPGNDWTPVVAVDLSGRVCLAWDTYRDGNYDVLLRTQGNAGTQATELSVAATLLSETQPSMASDSRGRVWIAYDEGTAAWGKDYGFWWWIEQWPQGTRLYEQRLFRVRCIDSGRLLEPPDPFASMPLEFREFSEQPVIRVDRHDRPWVFFRHRTAKNPRADGWAAGGWWELHAIYLDGDRWSDPIPFPRSMGRQSQPSSVASSPDAFEVVWGSDGRSFPQPADGIRSRLHTGFIDINRSGVAGSTPQPPRLMPYSPPDLSGLSVKNVHADETGDLKRIRAYSITSGGKQLKIYRGDLHRHTEISGDGVGDGTLTDLYRYALDAAALDYVMVTDHGMGADRDYPWWRTQKSNDMFHVPGRFVPMYGYERSIRYPWGHRNVIWSERGHRTFPTTKAKVDPTAPKEKTAAQTGPAEDDTDQLYANLRKTGGIATLHTSASDQGTDWETGFDPTLEPFVEIFQGYHTSYEGLDTPLAIDDKTAIVHGPYRPSGFVWNALEKGYRLGFQASSDHIATHTSYACIWSESLDRRALVDAMKKRHSYAATDNIILDVRSGDHLMGDEFTVSGAVSFDVKVHGTAPLAKVEIIRNRMVVYSHSLRDSQASEFRWTDMQPAINASYYYVRVQQTDRQMAWSSPMWVTVR